VHQKPRGARVLDVRERLPALPGGALTQRIGTKRSAVSSQTLTVAPKSDTRVRLSHCPEPDEPSFD
jgi:hypothetical protein